MFRAMQLAASLAKGAVCNGAPALDSLPWLASSLARKVPSEVGSPLQRVVHQLLDHVPWPADAYRPNQQQRSASFAAGAAAEEVTDAGSPSSSGRASSGASSSGRHCIPDPLSLVKDELDIVAERLRRSILSDIPVLERASSYFFDVGAHGKRLRPSILLLLATSLSPVPPGKNFMTPDYRPANEYPAECRRQQQRVAEITELIHVASLLHDDVIDDANTRRGVKALNTVFGNKVAILAGDFLLARASITLASLRNTEVIQLLSQVLEHLVAGEILQMTSSEGELMSMEHYMRKTYYKTASLMANSCKAVALLAGQPAAEAQLAWAYGNELGLAFQLTDDVLDFTGSSQQLGKPALNDLRSGLATAPVLFAAQQHPQLVPLIQRRFRDPGDVEAAQQLVADSSGVQQAQELAARHSHRAMEAVQQLPACCHPAAEVARSALMQIAEKVVSRQK